MRCAAKGLATVALGAAMVCGCVPTVLPTVEADSVGCIVAGDGEKTAVYAIGPAQKALLKDAFAAWKRAGFEGFDTSFATYAPTLSLIGKQSDGGVYSIDFGPKEVVARETDGMGEHSQYIRAATAADAAFRQFVLKCIADGKIKKMGQ